MLRQSKRNVEKRKDQVDQISANKGEVGCSDDVGTVSPALNSCMVVLVRLLLTCPFQTQKFCVGYFLYFFFDVIPAPNRWFPILRINNFRRIVGHHCGYKRKAASRHDENIGCKNCFPNIRCRFIDMKLVSLFSEFVELLVRFRLRKNNNLVFSIIFPIFVDQ